MIVVFTWNGYHSLVHWKSDSITQSIVIILVDNLWTFNYD